MVSRVNAGECNDQVFDWGELCPSSTPCLTKPARRSLRHQPIAPRLEIRAPYRWVLYTDVLPNVTAPRNPQDASTLTSRAVLAQSARLTSTALAEVALTVVARQYLAAILDLFSRFIVGWAVSAVNDRHLAIKALEMALKRRRPDAGLLHHSDPGCTYASEDYQTILDAHGITCSMSRRGIAMTTR